MLNHVAPAYAGIISTDKLMSQEIVSEEREVLHEAISRAEVQVLLGKHGVTAEHAMQRVDALTEAEVNILAQKFNELPAAGSIGSAAAILILVLLIIALALAR